mgnify:CR=1 FL=1
MDSFKDIIDELFTDLMSIKKVLRNEQMRGSFKTQARIEIDKYLKNIDKETEIPKI